MCAYQQPESQIANPQPRYADSSERLSGEANQRARGAENGSPSATVIERSKMALGEEKCVMNNGSTVYIKDGVMQRVEDSNGRLLCSCKWSNGQLKEVENADGTSWRREQGLWRHYDAAGSKMAGIEHVCDRVLLNVKGVVSKEFIGTVTEQNIRESTNKSVAPESASHAEREATGSTEQPTFKGIAKPHDDPNRRPYIEIELHDCIKRGTPPTETEIGNKIARAMGFNEDEMVLYASLKNLSPPARAFYQAYSPNDGQIWVHAAQQNPYHCVRVGERDPRALQEMRDWLKEHRAKHTPHNGIDEYDWAKERTAMEAVFTHVYNPVANATGSALRAVADIMQGCGLPLHAISDRTFVDRFADYLREKGDKMPLNNLYTKEETRDALVMIANIYGMAGGSSIPYLATGVAGRVVGCSARSLELASQILGAAGTGGQVYDTALTIQARNHVLNEMNGAQLSPEELNKKITAIKEGHCDAKVRSEMETKAIIAAALAAPAGVIQGKLMNQLSERIAGGVPLEQMPPDLVRDLGKQLTKAGLLTGAQSAWTEGAFAASGVKTPREALQDFANNLPESVGVGVLVAGTAEGIAGLHHFYSNVSQDAAEALAGKLQQAGQKPLSEEAKNDIASKLNAAFNRAVENGRNSISNDELKLIIAGHVEDADAALGHLRKAVNESALKHAGNDGGWSLDQQFSRGGNITPIDENQHRLKLDMQEIWSKSGVADRAIEATPNQFNFDMSGRAGSGNCTSCVAAFLRSLKEGHTRNAFELREPLGVLSEKERPRFIKYMEDNSKVELTPHGSMPKDAGHYAVTFRIKSIEGTLQEHVVYCMRTNDGQLHMFDPQSGKRYDNRMINQVLSSEPRFYKANMALDANQVPPYAGYKLSEFKPQEEAKPQTPAVERVGNPKLYEGLNEVEQAKLTEILTALEQGRWTKPMPEQECVKFARQWARTKPEWSIEKFYGGYLK